MPRDTAIMKGRVKRKYEEGGNAFVELELSITNQRGEVTTPGSALAVMPRRGA
jgi:hypothetical protein